VKRFLKIVSVVVALSLLFSFLSSCKKNDGRNKNAALEAYNALESDIDKLFYSATTLHSSAGRVASLKSDPLGMFTEMNVALMSDKCVETSFELDFNKVVADGEDILAKIDTDSLVLKGNRVTGQLSTNVDFSASVAGVNLEAGIISDSNAIIIDCPSVFQKPFYIPKEAVPEVGLEVLKLVSKGDISALFGSLASVVLCARENLVKGDLEYVFGLLKECLPLNRITSETVTVTEHKGDYITSDIDAECITLSLDSKGLDRFLTNVNNTVLVDDTFKTIVVSLMDAVLDGYSEVEKDGADYYAVFCNAFKDFILNFDSEADDYGLTVKRYFSEGYNVKLDVELKIGDKHLVSAILWDVYQDASRQYGVKVSNNGNLIVDVVGGANADNADLSVKCNVYDDAKENCNLVVTANRKGQSLKANGSLKFPDNCIDFEWNDDGSKGSVKVTSANKSFSVTLNAEVTKFEDSGKYTVNGEVACSFGGNFDLSGKLSLVLDTQSGKETKSTKEEGCFVVNGMYDVKYVDKNIKPGALMLLQGFGDLFGDTPEIGDDSTDESIDLEDDFSTESSEDISISMDYQ